LTARADDNYPAYRVPFPLAPSSTEALAKFPDRQKAVIGALACQADMHLLLGITGADQDYEGIASILIAKMAWLAGAPNEDGQKTLATSNGTDITPCDDAYVIAPPRPGDNPVAEFWTDEWNLLLDDISNQPSQTLKNRMIQIFGSACDDGMNGGPLIGVTHNLNGRFFNAAFPLGALIVRAHISPGCLQSQINNVLRRVDKVGQLGTSGLPCQRGFPETVGGLVSLSFTNGEWDTAVRSLIRVLYLNDRYRMTVQGIGEGGSTTEQVPILGDDVVTRVRDYLINVGGSPGEPSYPLLGCGNTEDTTGSPEDREDSSSWWHDALNDIGDALIWLFRRQEAIYLLPTAAIVGPIIGCTGGSVVGCLGGDVLVSEIRIPESENHRFQIESSRFLKNQANIKYLKSRQLSADNTEDAWRQVRDWLLDRMQQVMKQDFIEYNARPYGRYSLNSILNLADFSDDADVKRAARLVLEYTLAKFSVGSNQGRRLVPFRRRQDDVVQPLIEGNHPFFDQANGADHVIALGFMFAGQSQQFPLADETQASVPLHAPLLSAKAALDLANAATTTYRPLPITLDPAVRPQNVSQRYHHGGFEAYYSTPALLLTAGGVRTKQAYEATVDDAISLPIHIGPLNHPEDRGAGVPTTLMIAGARSDPQTLPMPTDSLNPPKIRPGDFLRIEGQLQKDGEAHTYDHNLCMWQGFACGINIKLPQDMTDCINGMGWKLPLPDGPPGAMLRFFDSTQCTPYQSHSLFIVIYTANCQSGMDGCTDNYGFFEVADHFQGSFDSFKQRIIAGNASRVLDAGRGSGQYAAANGHRISWNATAHQQHDNKSGIDAIDGVPEPDLDQWQRASGMITSTGDGLVRITGLDGIVELDFRDARHPALNGP
jgi:hypothetical protein